MKIELDEITLPAGLYLVATPIGNLGDITIRALETLKNVDIIYCEDTRQTKKLLNAYQIKTKTASYHDHSSESVRQSILHKIKEEKKSIALVSDAGMPIISDPGYKLVQRLVEENIPVTSLPGANAVLTALQLSGLPSEPFTFLGFLPSKSTARKKVLQSFGSSASTLIFYEGKQRIKKTLQDIIDIFPDRQVSLARELTKKFEEILRGAPEQVLTKIEERDDIKGEFVILVSPNQNLQEVSQEDLEKQIKSMVRDNIPIKVLSEELASISNWSKKDIYNLALKLK